MDQEFLLELCMIWTIRLAVAAYLFRISMILGRKSSKVSATERWIWTVGAAFSVAHLVFAFSHVHGWSHEHAVQHTAEATERMIGIKNGQGVWVNYVFTIVWLADCLRLWRLSGQESHGSRWLDRVIHGFLAFVVLNATVVFGPPVYRYLALPCAVGLIWLWSLGRQN